LRGSATGRLQPYFPGATTRRHFMKPAIIVHGGAGPWNMRGANLQQAREACTRAATHGQQILLAGGSALDAVEAAVQILEDDPSMDAGRGSFLNSIGEVEMDAMIMDGRTLDLGAVGAVQQVRYPISLARRVLEASEHAFLVGIGANAFADAINFPRCDAAWLITPAELARHQALQQARRYETDVVFREPGALGDTVGAVALDSNGNVAAATSTGGTRNKLPGRVGDSPLPGAGAYADNRTGAVSATGHGEAIMKVLLSKQVCDFIGLGLRPTAACEGAIALLQDRVAGEGGVVAIDRRGEIGLAFNTNGMPYAYTTGDDPLTIGS
jgi:beta-aspartyl-peptidase (threonine type)